MAEDLRSLSTVTVWRYETFVFSYLYYFIHLFDQKSSLLTKAAFIWYKNIVKTIILWILLQTQKYK